MSDKAEENESTPTIIEQTLSITPEQLKSYAEEKGCTGVCEACGKKSWIFPTEKGKPALFMSYSVRDTSSADWSFHMVCDECGNTRKISAGYVWGHFFQGSHEAE